MPYKNAASIGISMEMKDVLGQWKQHLDPKMSWEDFLNRIFVVWHRKQLNNSPPVPSN